MDRSDARNMEAREHAAPDGTIEVKYWPFGGLRGGGATLGDLANGTLDNSIHKAAAELKPDECAGPTVRSPADLFSKLVFEAYPNVIQIRDSLRHDIAVALLLERDGMSMPADSIANALRIIWTWVWELGKAYRQELTESKRTEADQLASARAESAIVRGESKRRA